MKRLLAIFFISFSAIALADKPNIIFILADDLGYGDLSSYGSEKIQTPNIDRLAEEGALFTDAHSGASTCTPTRYGIMTGRHSWRSWMKFSALSTSAPLLIDEGRKTIATMLKSAGYNTSIVGKWHLGYGREKGFELNRGNQAPNYWETREKGPDWNGILKPGPLDCGFDYAYVVPVANSFPPYVIVENQKVVGLQKDSPIGEMQSKNYGTMEGGKGARWTDEELIDKFTSKLKSELQRLSKSDNPFFLYYPATHPHVGSRRVKGQAHWPHERFKKTSQAGPYGDTIHELDWSVGEILKTLEELNIADNTLIIFSSDNGSSQRKLKGHKTNSILRGGKGDLTEGGHRVPFVARWPAKIKAGIQSKETISLTDMMATFAAIIDKDLPKGVAPDSFNVFPALLGKALPPERLVVLSSGGTGDLAIRSGKWKLMLGQGNCGYKEFFGRSKPKPGAPPAQLFDLEKDLSEKTNLYMKNPEIVYHMLLELKKIVENENYNPSSLSKASEETPSIDDLNKMVQGFIRTNRSR